MQNTETVYEVTFVIRTTTDPHGLVFALQQKIKSLVNVLSIKYHLIENRPTTNEHHGGVVDDNEE